MRNQTISTSLSDAAQLPAESINPAGWLTGPAGRPADHRAAGARFGAQASGATVVSGTPVGLAGPADPGGGRTTEPRRIRRPVRRPARPRRRVGSSRAIVRPQRPSSVAGQVAVAGLAATNVQSVRRVQVDQGPVGYRMGRWARLAITVTVLAAAVVLTVSLSAGPTPSRLVDVTVGPGDTLWSIATVAAPDRDPRAVIEEIRELNDVPGTVLPVGVVLRVPVSAE